MPSQVLVMANLKSQGWRDAINKKKGLDVHHLRLAFKVTISQRNYLSWPFFLLLYLAVPCSTWQPSFLFPNILVGGNFPSFSKLFWSLATFISSPWNLIDWLNNSFFLCKFLDTVIAMLATFLPSPWSSRFSSATTFIQGSLFFYSFTLQPSFSFTKSILMSAIFSSENTTNVNLVYTAYRDILTLKKNGRICFSSS